MTKLIYKHLYYLIIYFLCVFRSYKTVLKFFTQKIYLFMFSINKTMLLICFDTDSKPKKGAQCSYCKAK